MATVQRDYGRRRGTPARPDQPRHAAWGDARRARRPRVRWWWLALLAVLIVTVAAGAAVGVAGVLDPRYGARAELIYDVGDADAQPEADRLLATQAVVLGSRAVLGPVAEANGLAPRQLSRQVEVELVEESQVIEVTVTAPSAEAAADLAEDLVDTYLEVAADLDAVASAGPTVLTPPFPLDEPLGPGPLQALAAGTLAGIVLAVVTVLALRRLGREGT